MPQLPAASSRCWWVRPFLLVFAFLAGSIVGLDSTGSGAVQDVALSLRADRSVYAVGQRVVLTLTATNMTARPMTLTFPSAQVYDFVVQQDGREVWQWSRDKMFSMMLTEASLAPGKSRSYTESWDQVDIEGRRVAPGAYEVVGLLAGKPPAVSRSLKIEIK